MEPMTILLAIDDDPIRTHAVRAVADWLPDDAKVVALHVGLTPAATATGRRLAMPGPGLAGYPLFEVRALPTMAELDDHARAVAERAAEATDGQARVEHGDPATVIAQVAGEIGADLVVVGTGDRSWLSRLFEPSVASSVASDAPCSVLVVRRPDTDD